VVAYCKRMKQRPLIILLALGNLGLAAALIVTLANRPLPRSAPVEVRQATNAPLRQRHHSPPPSPATPAPEAAGRLPRIWPQVESTDYAQYIANLRAIGCPEETIRDLIIADVNKLYAEKLRALNPSLKTTNEWWRYPATDPAAQREYYSQSRALNREKRDLVKALLGVDLDKEMQRQQGYVYGQAEPALDFLSADKRDKLQALLQKHQEQHRALYDQQPAYGGDWQQWQEQSRRLREQQQAEIAALLTPAELESYQARTSPTAQSLKVKLRAFEATEEEFLALFRLQKSFDDQYLYAPGMATNWPARQSAQKQLEAEVRKTLGEQRYAEYQRAQDPSWSSLVEVLRRHQLPATAADSIYELKKTAEEQKRQLMANRDLDAAERRAALAALKENAEQYALNLLGPAAFKEYQQMGGWWLANLGR